jgi:hypothetical protein
MSTYLLTGLVLKRLRWISCLRVPDSWGARRDCSPSSHAAKAIRSILVPASVEEGAGILRQLALDGEDRLVGDGESDLRRDGLPLGVAARHREEPLLPRAILVPIRRDADLEDLASRWHGELLPVGLHTQLSDADGGEEHVGNETLLHLDLDQPVVSLELDEAQIVEVLSLHAEENEAIRRGRVEQHREGTPHLRRARVDEDLDAGSLIVEIARLVRRREHEGLGANRHFLLRLAHPGDPVVALLPDLEAQLRRAILTRPQLSRQHRVRLVSPAAESPGPLAPAVQRRKAGQLGAELRQPLAAHLATGGIEPDLPPALTGDRHPSLDRHRLLVGILGTDADPDHVSYAVDAALRMEKDEPGPAGHPQRAPPDHLAPGGVDDPGLDAELRVASREAGGIDAKSGDALGIRHQLVTPDGPAAPEPRRRRPARIHPRVGEGRRPVRVIVALLDDCLDPCVGDRSPEIVSGADLHLDRLSAAVGALLPAHCSDLHPVLGQLVLLQAEEGRRAESSIPRLLGEDHPVGSQDHALVECQLAETTSKVVQEQASLVHAGAARVLDPVAEPLSPRRGVTAVRADPRQGLPLDGLAGAVGRAIREGVDSPVPPLPITARGNDLRHGLSRAAAPDHECGGALVGVRASRHGESVRSGDGFEATGDALLGGAAPGPEHHRSVLERLARIGVAEQRCELLTRGLHDQRRVGDQQQCARAHAARLRDHHVGTGRGGLLEPNLLPARCVVTLQVEPPRPGANRPVPAQANSFDPIAPIGLRPEVEGAIQLDRVKREAHHPGRNTWDTNT